MIAEMMMVDGMSYLVDMIDGQQVLVRYSENNKYCFSGAEYCFDMEWVSRIIRPVKEIELDQINTVQALINMVTGIIPAWPL